MTQENITFTNNAAEKVRKMIEAEGDHNLKLRVYIVGGGCSGFSYGFKFDQETLDGDTAIQNQDVTLLVDPMSFQYLAGAEVDFLEDLQGSRFIINNPNAKTTCGCGSSFSI
jgi:iron-sulfur cluster insertion protein